MNKAPVCKTLPISHILSLQSCVQWLDHCQRKSAKTLVQAFISCHLDYCNALLYGISDSLFKHLQSIHNAAARFLTGASRRDHISPVLRSLHWLPVKQWVDYKLATLVYKSLRSQASSYLVDDCQLIGDSRRPGFALLTPTSSLFGEQTLDLATGVSQSRV